MTPDASGSPTSPDGDSPSPIGWWRAAATALAIIVAGAGLFVFGPNWVLTHLAGLSRNGRVAVATTAFIVLLIAAAWVLRRLQSRGLI